MMKSIHKTVLLNEAIQGLNLEINLSDHQVIVDGTFGGGGHSLEICRRYKGVKIIAIDQDAGAHENKADKFAGLDCDMTFVNENFKNIDQVLKDLEISEVDGVLLDLGLSSDQLENSGRGFSFLKDEPLLMTMKDKGDNLPSLEDLTASDIVNTWSEENLATIIFGYGEEKFSKKIARAIADAREQKKIETTFDLVRVIEGAVPGVYKRGRLHFATRTFQAIRIAVNDELGVLTTGLQKGFEVLKADGRMAVISFHSLEDRIVKKFFKAKADAKEAILINKKVILASSEEIKNNSRARSAKLRILSKIK